MSEEHNSAPNWPDWSETSAKNSSIFEPGRMLETTAGTPFKIIRHLASGGQGDVYASEYEGKTKILKWYKNPGNAPDAFYDNLISNAKKGSPDKAFLWPEAVTERTNGSFGCIMDLIPDGYHELTSFLTTRVRFSSFKTAVEACIHIASAYRNLHLSGLTHPDIEPNNIYIDPQTGDVRIASCDSIVHSGTPFYQGTLRYAAPEIICSNALPNAHSDRHSLSVILFQILCMNHPLEGRKALVPLLTPEAEKKLYGSEALFIFDPTNQENAPAEGVHVNAIRLWSYMPDYIKDIFQKAFSQDALKDPGKRPLEAEWLDVLTRFQNSIVSCSCGNEVFVSDASTAVCDSCGKEIHIRQD